VTAKLLSWSTADLKLAATAVRWGELVVFPTETVYGLWADARNDWAVQKIFEAKNRPSQNPLIIHLADKDMISDYAKIRSPKEKRLIDLLMPWPLTIVLESRETISLTTRANAPTVAVRIPSHALAHGFLARAWIPIAAPSANTSGRPSATNKDMVRKDLSQKVPYIIDGWSCEYGIESTVIKVKDDSIFILRPWFVTKEDIELALWDTTKVLYSEARQEQSPGTRYQHYTPSIPVCRFHETGELQLWSDTHPQDKVALIVTEETYNLIRSTITAMKNVTYFHRWSMQNLAACAHNLYNLYFQAEQKEYHSIWVESLPMQGLGISIMNRINKSVSPTPTADWKSDHV